MSPSPRRSRRRRTRSVSSGPSSPEAAAAAAAEASDSGSDFEGAAAASKAGPKRRRSSSSSRQARPLRGARSPADKRALKAAAAAAGTPEKNPLFQAVASGRSAAQAVVDDWLGSYKKDQDSGFLELFNFLVRSCGCRGEVTLEMLRGLQNSEIIQQLTESFDEESAEYPLSLNTPVWRRFRTGFCELLVVLVRRAQHGIVYDGFLMDSLVALLTGLSDSQVRAFRHTSTLAAVKLMTGLMHVALSVSIQKENSQRQYEAERAKGLRRQAPGKLEGLLEQRKEFEEKQGELESLMNAIFKGVFVHRYRDLVPEIRAICIEEMGQWIQHYSACFLTDGYLKYIGWMLHDKQGEVRLKCLLALQGLYGNQETASRMELFTSRFKERMVSMVLDKEPQVAVEAVRLLTLILQNMDGLLTDPDCETVFPLVFASGRPLASAAGGFLYKKLLAPTASVPPRMEAAQGQRESSSSSRTFLLLLLRFSIESEVHDHMAYLVDSLWDCAAAPLKDWPAMTGLLLEEEEEEPTVAGLDDRQEGALVMLLVASMRQATEGHPPPGRASGKKAFSARERKVHAEDRLRLSQHLLPLLPQLIAKFSADAEKVVPLLEAPRYFDLALYSTGRLEKYLELLLTQLQEVVEKHVARAVLEAAAQTLHLLCSPELAFYARADFARSRLVDHLADKLQYRAMELLQPSSFLEEEEEEEEVYSRAATLKRLAIFHSAHDLTPWHFFEPCAHLLHHRVETGEVPQEVVVSAMSCCHFSLLWDLAHWLAAKGHLSAQELLSSLQEKVAQFFSLCQSCLVDLDPCVQEQAFVLLSDLLLIFGPQLTQGGHQELRPLLYRPEPSLQSQLAGFLMDRVFNHSQATGGEEEEEEEEEEGQIEQLHQRRILLAGFCKLIVYGVLDLSAASDVFKYYSKFYSDYGDIIKETLNRARQIDRNEWAQTLLLSLQQLWTQLLLEEGPAGVDSAAFLEARDLARRFSLLFGLHQLQNRSALVALHKAGIKFAFQDPSRVGGAPASPPAPLPLLNLPFLELLSEFSPRLMEPDKALLLTYLKKSHQACLSLGGSDPPGLASCLLYQRSLSSPQDLALMSPNPDLEPRPQLAPKRRRLDGSSETKSGPSSPLGPLRAPLLSSTALREKQPPPPSALHLGPEEEESGPRLGSWGQDHDDQGSPRSSASGPRQPPLTSVQLQRGKGLPRALLGPEPEEESEESTWGSEPELGQRLQLTPVGEAAEASEEEEEEDEGLGSGQGSFFGR